MRASAAASASSARRIVSVMMRPSWRSPADASRRWIAGVVSISSMLARMDTDQLLAFQRVVREGSFSRAAVALGVGQPAISARIQALEAAVGGALFTRGRRVALTPLGESFLGYASRAIDVLGAGVDDARRVQGGERGRVSIATLSSLAA